MTLLGHDQLIWQQFGNLLEGYTNVLNWAQNYPTL